MLNLRLQKYTEKGILRTMKLCFEADVNSLAAERIFLGNVPYDNAVDVKEFSQKLMEVRKLSYVFDANDLNCEFINNDLRYCSEKYERACRYIFDSNISFTFPAGLREDDGYINYLYEFFRSLGDAYPAKSLKTSPHLNHSVWNRFNVCVRELLGKIYSGFVKKGDNVTDILFPPYSDLWSKEAFTAREKLAALLTEKDDEYYLSDDDLYSTAFIAAVFESFAFREAENRRDLLSRMDGSLASAAFIMPQIKTTACGRLK